MFRGFLERVLADPSSFAQRSYMHPANGFYKIELGTVLDGKLRLHVWPGGWLGPGHVHDHRWDFVSHVLYGELYERRFYEKPDEVSADEPLVHTHPYDTETLRRMTGGISLLSSHIRRAGDTYSCQAGECHQLWPRVSGEAATIVLTGPPNGKEARVFEEQAKLSYSSKSLDPDVLKGIILRALECLR